MQWEEKNSVPKHFIFLISGIPCQFWYLTMFPSKQQLYGNKVMKQECETSQYWPLTSYIPLSSQNVKQKSALLHMFIIITIWESKAFGKAWAEQRDT